jgi:hypothetical protein
MGKKMIDFNEDELRILARAFSIAIHELSEGITGEHKEYIKAMNDIAEKFDREFWQRQFHEDTSAKELF